jgi:hypothetical protein
MADPTCTESCREVFRFERVFATLLERANVRGSSVRRPRLALPDGPSTAGGARARVPIVLDSSDPREPPLLAGWVDPVHGRAGLRSHAALQAALSARRPGARVDRDSYESFLIDCRKVLAAQRVEVQLESVPPPLPAAERAPEPSPRTARPSRLELALTATLVGLASCGTTLALLW